MQFIATSPIALRYIVDNISDSYIVLTSANNIMDFNKQFLDTFKVETENIRSKNLCLKYGFEYSESKKEIRKWDNQEFIIDYFYLTKDKYFNNK